MSENIVNTSEARRNSPQNENTLRRPIFDRGARLEGPLIPRDDCTRNQNEPKTNNSGRARLEPWSVFLLPQTMESIPARRAIEHTPWKLFLLSLVHRRPTFQLPKTCRRELYYLHCHGSAAPCRLNWDETPVQHGRCPSFCLVFETSWHPESRYRPKTRHPNHHCRFQARCWTP